MLRIEIEAYQSLGGAVESMTMVAAELGVSALEGRVSGSLGLLDTVFVKIDSSALWAHSGIHHHLLLLGFQVVMLGRSYPLR